MSPEKLAELRAKMTDELELLYNQAQRRGSQRPSPSQIVDCLFTVAVIAINSYQESSTDVRKNTKRTS